MDQASSTFGRFRLDNANAILLRDGEPLPVGQRGVRVLEALLQRPGSVVSKAELMDAAWPGIAVEEANLSVQIATLRKVLGPAPGGREWIATVHRVGYRFVPEQSQAEVEEVPSTAPGPAAASSWWPSPIGAEPALRRFVALAAVALAAAVAFGLMALRLGGVDASPGAAARPAVAVLPFDDMSGDPELAYFGAGVSEDITSMLARVPNIAVVARNSSFQYAGRPVDVRELGEELGATHVLEGSVRKEADRLRIVAQLVDARTGRHMWAERYDRTGTDPRAMQDEVTQKIVAALAGTAGLLALQEYGEAWGKDSARLEEYDYLLRTLSRIAIGTPESAERSEAILAEGMARFPSSSLLKAQAASTVMWRFARGWSDAANPLEDIRRAGRLAREALADPIATPMQRVGAHVSLAYANMAERKFDQAVAEAEAAMALAPYDGRMAYYLAEIPVTAGRPGLTLEWIERAEALYHPNDPRQQELASMKALALFRAHGPSAALEVLDRIRSNDDVVLRTTYLMRAGALVMLGRVDEAKVEARKLREHDPSWSLARHRARFFYQDPEVLDGTIRALAVAGIPEN